ncbi:MAG TPA: hypothetical protein VII11_05965 [Bacteroidota bacterium]
MKLLSLAILATFILVMPASAGRQGVTELITSELSITGPIVQQSPDPCSEETCVRNPTTNCLWNVDDRWTAGIAARKIGAGVSASGSVCLISDNHVPFWGAQVRAEKGDLLVTLHFEPQNVTFRLDPVQWGTKAWEWKGCMSGPYYPGWNALPEIPDSNGGHGVLGTVTFTITNPTNKFIANPEIIIIERPGLRSRYCTSEDTNFNKNGASWRIGGFIPEE